VKIEQIEKQNTPKEILPQIVDRIFAICKSDSSFHLKGKLEIVENKIRFLEQKIERQNALLSQSEEIKKDLVQRSEILNNYIQQKQTELLESIGSEV
jgi:hypothetical protein